MPRKPRAGWEPKVSAASAVGRRLGVAWADLCVIPFGVITSCLATMCVLMLLFGVAVAQAETPEGSDASSGQPVEKAVLDRLAALSLAELGFLEVEVASPGDPELISEAPAVASVITSEQIRAMGATHLGEVLETVPGLHIVPSQVKPLDPIFSIRGVHSQANNQVLTLLDGLPIAHLLTGGPLFVFRMPVANIARVEVIRGPGSAVYGADAFAGVVNIITKKAEDVDGTEVGFRLGSFDTLQVWVNRGLQLKGWDITLGFEWQQSEGDTGRRVEHDLQTTFDQLFGTSASLAPGSLQTGFEILDAHLTLEREDWTIRLWSWLENDRGVGAGGAQALDPEGEIDSTHLLLDIDYQTQVSDTWRLGSRLSFLYLDQVQDGNLRLFPRGTVLPIGPDGNVSRSPEARLVHFPDGFIGNPADYDRTLSLDTFAVYEGWGKHRWRLGAGYHTHWLDTAETLNFGPGVIDGSQPVVDGTLTDITDSPFIFVSDQDRDEWYVSLQDRWEITDRWELTAGMRFDRYSDFGSTLNPRFALVHKPAPGGDPNRPQLTTKLLYGTAFRAPSFVELFLENNPVQLGNPDLDPETIEVLELVFDYRPTSDIRAALSLFAYEIDDLIDLVPDPGLSSITYRNAGQQDGHGLEIEAAWQVTEHCNVQGNFSWQRSTDQLTDTTVPDAPSRQLYLSMHWSFLPRWSLNGGMRWIAGRERALGDVRPDIDDYSIVDLTVRRRFQGEAWEMSVSLSNLFDEKALEPSPQELSGDYPLEGRRLILGLSHRF